MTTDVAAPPAAVADTDAKSGIGWIRRLWPYIDRHRADVVVAVLAALGASIAQTGVPLVAREIVDNVIVHKRSELWPWLTALVVLALVAFGLAYLRRYRGGRIGIGVQLALRNDIHDHLLQLDQQNLSTMPTGQLVSRASSDTTLILGLLNFLPLMTGNVLLMVSSLVVMLWLSPLLSIVGLITLPALFVVSYRLRQKVFPATWDGQQREGDVAQIVDEDVNGVRVVKAFGQESRELRRMAEAAQRLYGSHMRAVRLQSRYQPLLEAIPSLAQVAVLAFGGWLALHGHITIGTFLAFSTYIAQFASPARQLAGVLSVGQQARAGVERIFQLLDLEPSVADRPDAVDLRPMVGAIEFRDVHFAFGADGDEVLRGVSLRIEPGETVALVGASGSGKSTLAALVPRLADPTQGSVLIDGHDLRQVRLESLRGGIGVAFEDSFLFSDTVRANIAYARLEATEAEIKAAAVAAAADDFIRELPAGYETTVGERGLTLSGGQRQRIALARAILADPRVLVLDDATSAVDAATEERIHDALRDLMAGRTTLLIAHRISTLHLADRVVMLDQGRVVDAGTHRELLARNPDYRGLLSGLDGELAAQIGDRIETLSTVASASGGVTEAAWAVTREARSLGGSNPLSTGAPSLGPGLGGGRGGTWKMNLAPTPELLAKVAALPPIRDVATIDLARESRHDRRFSLVRLLQEFRRPLALGLVLVVLDALAGLAGPVLVKVGVDDGVARGTGTTLLIATALFLAIAMGDLLVQVAETFVTGRAAERVMLTLRIRIWAQLQRLSLDYYEREMAGRIMTRMTTDVDQFEALVSSGLLSALVALVTFVGVGVALVVVNPVLGGCTLTVAIPLAIATFFFRRISTRLYDQARDRIAAVNADFQESLSGVREAQAFTHEAATRERFHALGRSYFDSRLAAQRLVATYFPFVQFLSSIADVIVLGVGATLIAHHDLTAGALIAFILYIDLFFSPIQQLSQVFDSWQQTRISVQRIAELMVLEPRTPEAVDPVPLTTTVGELALEAVEFSYPAAVAAPPALTGVTLRVAPGETVALVGQTGAGKSTVMKMIARFYDPDAGAVLLDEHDLRDVALEDLRTHLGYVPQESFLFSGTIRDNIAYGRPEASDAEVEAAARAVGAHDFVAQLPAGYLTTISERGKSLSSGQRQLIALARAQLVDPSLLLLDEATANLDLATEARVGAAMAQVAAGRTTILIAHRLQTARTADRIALLHAGRIAEVGSHDELLALGGRYAAMWRAFEVVGGASG